MTNILRNIKSICRIGVGNYNEDSCDHLDNAAWVIDGATGLNGKNLVSDTSDAHWYSNWWNSYIRENLKDQTRLDDFLYKGLEDVRREYIEIISNKGIDISSISKIDLPSASICLTRVIDNRLEYIILGDCRLYIGQSNETIKISDESVSKLDDEVFEKMRSLDDFGNVSLDDTKSRVMDKIVENRLKNNTDEGYWILSFDKDAAYKARSGSIDIDQETRVMIASDGYFSASEKYHLYEERDLLDLTFKRGMESIYREIRDFESDEERVRFIPRFKSMDDSTCVVFEISPIGRRRVLHISAQKPDYTGSGIYMSGIIKGMDHLTSGQALIAGVDSSDDLPSMMEKFKDIDLSFYPVLYNDGILDFNVPGMSDNMPYPSTIYKNMTDDMAGRMESSFLSKLDQAVKEFKPDLIVCHHLYFTTSLVRENINDIPVVAICHGTCLRQLMSHDFKKDLIIEAIPKLDKIYALHDIQAGLIRDIFNIEDSRIEVLGSGYDKTIFNCESRSDKSSSKEITLAYAGKLAYAKGLMEFFDALEKVDFPEEDLVFYLAGDGSDQEEVINIKNKGNKSKFRVEFLGRLNQYQLASMLNQSDIFVLPSYYEGLPLVLLEAMACGNSILTTDIDGVKEWLGQDINTSGMISYVGLPEMEAVSRPKVDRLGEYVDRFALAIEDSIRTRLDKNYRQVNIEEMSWNGLAKKLYDSCD